MKERVFKTRAPLFRQSIALIVTSDVAESARKRDVDGDNSEALTAVVKGVVSIFVPPRAGSGVIAHEAFHAAAEILKYCGVRLSYTAQEQHAYLLGWIVDWVTAKI